MAPRRLQENMDRLARGEAWVAPPGAPNLLGFRPVAMETGRAVIELVPDERHVTISFAYLTTLEEGETCPTLDLQINFLRPARRLGPLRAEARLRKSGRSTGFSTCEITDAEGQLVAHATGTCMRIVPRG
jgi:acyl-coenzyme A thioesterase PaaI-like protein